MNIIKKYEEIKSAIVYYNNSLTVNEYIRSGLSELEKNLNNDNDYSWNAFAHLIEKVEDQIKELKNYIKECEVEIQNLMNEETEETKKESIKNKEPLYIEKKERRLQLLIQESLYKKIKEQANLKNQSVNSYIHLILEKELRIKEEE